MDTPAYGPGCQSHLGGGSMETGRRIQRELSCVRMQIGEASGQLNGELRIGTGTTILTFFLSPVLKRFR